MPIAFELLAERLLADAAEHLKAWLPNGRRQGREWCVGSLEGQPGQSLKINLDSGKWQDWATGEKGGDLIALYAAMHRLSQSEAAKQLGAEEGEPAPLANGHDRAPPETLERPPADANLTASAFRHPSHGIPTQHYVYRDSDGAPLFVVARYELSAGKQFAPWTWREGRWRAKAPPRPRPLYGLQRLNQLPGRVVVVEGEKAADALQAVLHRSPVLTWPSGANAWQMAAWDALRGRQVLIWPDADPPGAAALKGIATKLLNLGCPVWRIDTEGLPDGYDAADAVTAGITGPTLNDWLKARLKPIQRADQIAKEPQRVLAPTTLEPAATIEEPPPLTDGDVPVRHRPKHQPDYAVAQEFGLKYNGRGIFQNVSNVSILLRTLIARGTVTDTWWDDFLQQQCTAKGEWTGADTLHVLSILQDGYPFEKISRGMVDDAVALYAYEQRRNCAQEWLRSLTWDGIARLVDLVPVGFGADRSPYHQAIGRCFLMGMVARVLRPGCQVDNLPVFEGPQGLRKSSALRLLGGQYYAEVVEAVTSKDFYLSLQGKMLVEVAEFFSFRRAESDALKATITRTTDRYRAPYDRRPADHPRACVFAANTNTNQYLKDPTGARRFWPVKCGHIQLQWIEARRDQLLAEAVYRVDHGESWWNVPDEDAKREQSRRYEHDVIGEAIRHWVDSRKSDFTTLDVISYALGIEGVQRFDERLQNRVKAQLTHWGYQTALRPNGDGRAQDVWVKSQAILPSESNTTLEVPGSSPGNGMALDPDTGLPFEEADSI